MLIEFTTIQTDTACTITSAQLPGFSCSWPDQETAFANCAGKLKRYLQENRSKLPAEIIEELRGLIASVG